MTPIATNDIFRPRELDSGTSQRPYAYVSADNGIDGYSIDPVTGGLTPITGSPFADLGPSSTYEIDPSGLLLFGGDGYLWAINPSTGQLSPGRCLIAVYVCPAPSGYTTF